MAAPLSNDDVGSAVNRAIAGVIAQEIEFAGNHHQRKATSENKKPTSLNDVFGSVWITAGAGSVILLWGEAGDPIVELTHLKQPADEVGPLELRPRPPPRHHNPPRPPRRLEHPPRRDSGRCDSYRCRHQHLRHPRHKGPDREDQTPARQVRRRRPRHQDPWQADQRSHHLPASQRGAPWSTPWTPHASPTHLHERLYRATRTLHAPSRTQSHRTTPP